MFLRFPLNDFLGSASPPISTYLRYLLPAWPAWSAWPPGYPEALGGTVIWEQLTRAEPRVELYLDCKSTTGNKKITVNQSYKLMA